MQSRANAIIEAVIRYGVMPATKEVLRLGGLDYGICRPPFRPLDEERKALLEKEVRANLGTDYMRL